jgi:hypothetical protein
MSVTEFVDASGEVRLRGTITGFAPFNGGTLLLEVSTELALDNTGAPHWSFDPALMQTSDDVTLNADNQTLDVNTDGWYQVWYSFACRASAATVKAQVQSVIDAPNGTMIFQGSLGETEQHLDGSVSLLETASPFLSPPIPLAAGDTLTFRAAALYTAGSVGDAILSTNTYVAVVRLA